MVHYMNLAEQASASTTKLLNHPETLCRALVPAQTSPSGAAREIGARSKFQHQRCIDSARSRPYCAAGSGHSARKHFQKNTLVPNLLGTIRGQFRVGNAMSSLRWAVCWVAAGMFTVAPSVQAAEEVGKAVLIRTAVTGQNGPLVERAPVHRDERIKTSQSGLGQFVFRDGTKLAVGWGSSVVIDKYVFNDDASVKQLSIKAVKGTFRWISGKSKSSAYSIVTPAGTIGVRGTVFDFYVNRDGTTAMVLLEGKASFCGSNGCKQLTKKCDCVIGTPRKGVTDPTRVSRATLAALGTNKALPFLSGTQELSSSFGRGPSCGMRTASIQQNEGSARQPSRSTPAPANRAAPAPSASPRAADPTPSAPAPQAAPQAAAPQAALSPSTSAPQAAAPQASPPGPTPSPQASDPGTPDTPDTPDKPDGHHHDHHHDHHHEDNHDHDHHHNWGGHRDGGWGGRTSAGGSRRN